MIFVVRETEKYRLSAKSLHTVAFFYRHMNTNTYNTVKIVTNVPVIIQA